MTTNQLHRELATVLARLELVSSAPITAYNPGGATNDPSPQPPGDSNPPHDRYRQRLTGINQGLQRRLHAADTRDETRNAHAWAHNARLAILTDAKAELAQLTGRNGSPPAKHAAGLDTPHGIRAAITEDAPGRPARAVAERLGISAFIVQRQYVTMRLDLSDGTPLQTTAQDRNGKAAEYAARGMSERQIGMLLGIGKGTVRRALGRAA